MKYLPYLLAGVILTSVAISSTNSQWFYNLTERIKSNYEKTEQKTQETKKDEETLETIEITYPKIINLENITNSPAINPNHNRNIKPRRLSKKERSAIC